MESINEEEVQSLIEYFSKTSYRAKYEDDMAKSVLNKCIELAKLDYNITLLDNNGGQLCAHYPSQLIIIESELNNSPKLIEDTIYESNEQHYLKELVMKARSARCRTRFPIPVIFHQGKHICRSATLSGGPEIYGRSGLHALFANESSNVDVNDDNTMEEQCDNGEDDKPEANNKLYNKQADQSNYNWVLCDTVRKGDINLLKALKVGIIVDLMVEKKKVKFGVNVTSSEKVDKVNRYSDFTILSLPYPGCEFFREFRDHNYTAENMFYNWSQTHVDAEIIVPHDSITERLLVKWRDYKKWNLPTLTENYLQLLLRYTFDSSSGLLVHCISGWDRTPLFVSLLRICLWADGAIHKSLTPLQMLYFTVAYDWLLFGHDLQDRKNKGEDIFYYCFHFLKFVMGDEYSFQRCRVKVVQTNNPVAVEYMQCDGELEAGDLAQGSNQSLNSSWSSISSKSQEVIPSYSSQSDDMNNIFSGAPWLNDPNRGSESNQRLENSPRLENSSSVQRLENSPRWENGSPVQRLENSPRCENGSSVQRLENNPRWENGSSAQRLENSARWENGSSVQRLENNARWEIGSSVQRSENSPRWENGSSAQRLENNARWEIGSSVQRSENSPRWENGSSVQRLENSPRLENSASAQRLENSPSAHRFENGTSAHRLENSPPGQQVGNSPGGQSVSSSCTVIDGNTTPTPVPPSTPPSASQGFKTFQVTTTSPVAVPSRTSLRQRNESSSSLNVGSWQYVTSTGSLRSTTSGSTLSSANSRSSGTETAGNDSNNTDAIDGCFIRKRKPSTEHAQCGATCAVRRERLEQIRKLFAISYCQSIGHNLKDGSENSGISNIIGSIAGKIYSSQKS